MKKRALILFLITCMFLFLITPANALLCRGSDGYYHDCHSSYAPTYRHYNTYKEQKAYDYGYKDGYNYGYYIGYNHGYWDDRYQDDRYYIKPYKKYYVKTYKKPRYHSEIYYKKYYVYHPEVIVLKDSHPRKTTRLCYDRYC